VSAHVVTESDVGAFAAVTGAHHPPPNDPEWAARSQFGERIAHGMLIASLAVGLVDFDPKNVVALRRVRDLVFKRPVRLGDAIRVDAEQADRRPLGDGTVLVTYVWRVTNQADQLVCRMTVEALCREEPG
jgi:acyl dehydratase